jgi:hypothetical protein
MIVSGKRIAWRTGMHDQFPTISAYINQTIASMVDTGAEVLLRNYPNLVELRAREVSAALILINYMHELQSWRKLAMSKTLTSDQIDEFDYARMDQEEIDGGLYRVLEALTGHRSLGIDIDTITIYGFDKIDLGVYEPNWKKERQKNLENIRKEAIEAKALAESEKEVYVPINYVYKSTVVERKAYCEHMLKYHLGVLEKELPGHREYEIAKTCIAELREELEKLGA